MHETLLGATLSFPRLPGAPVIPCTTSKPRKGWVLANGQSPDTFVQSIKFFVSNIPTENYDDIKKGLDVVLMVSPSSNPIKLKLDYGELTTDGQLFDFEAMDLNQRV